jgi:curved DNA-binding protein CbpA
LNVPGAIGAASASAGRCLPDLYAVLGVDARADADTLREGYRMMAKRAHPDVGGSHEAFLLLEVAHRVLSSPARRDAYDVCAEVDEVFAAHLQSAVDVGVLESAATRLFRSGATNRLPMELRDDVVALLERVNQTLDTLRDERAGSGTRTRSGASSAAARGSDDTLDGLKDAHALLTATVVNQMSRWPTVAENIEAATEVKMLRRWLHEAFVLYSLLRAMGRSARSIVRFYDDPMHIQFEYHAAIAAAEVAETMAGHQPRAGRSYSLRRPDLLRADIEEITQRMRSGGIEPTAPPWPLRGPSSRPNRASKPKGAESRARPANGAASRSSSARTVNRRCAANGCDGFLIVGSDRCWAHASPDERTQAGDVGADGRCIALQRNGSRCHRLAGTSQLTCATHGTIRRPTDRGTSTSRSSATGSPGTLRTQPPATTDTSCLGVLWVLFAFVAIVVGVVSAAWLLATHTAWVITGVVILIIMSRRLGR